MNTLVRDFVHTLDSRFSDDTSKTTMAEWVTANTHLRKRPFSYKGYEFQIQIMNDMHPNLSCKKCSQVGLSETQVRKFLGWLRRNSGTSGIFTMPDDKMRDRISQTRVKPLVESEAVFNPPSADKPVRQKGLYQIDDSFAYFTGSTEGDATSIPADILIHDEIDLTDQAMIGLFQSRLQNSEHKIVQQFSTPTFPGYGVDLSFSESDQHEYMLRCTSCGHHQLPEFNQRFMCLPELTKAPDNLVEISPEQVDTIDMDNAYWRCERCSKPLDLADPALREWVPRYPGRRGRGYYVRPTSTARISIPYIFDSLLKYRRLDNMKGFYNTVLGETFNDANAQISEADIRTCLGPASPQEDDPTAPTFIGIDLGAICHLVLGQPGRTILFRQIPRAQLLDFVKGLFKKFNIISGCVDRYPDTTLAEQLRDIEDHKGIIMPIHYATSASAPPLTEVKDEFDETTHWAAHRTKTLDTVAATIRRQKISIQGYTNLTSVLITHLRDLIRVEHPEVPPVWNKTRGEDHLFHALGYMLLSQRLVDAVLYRTDQERRSNLLIQGARVLPAGDLSPHALNRHKPTTLGLR